MNNLVQCMYESWYMAVDMQLFLIAPPRVYILWRWEKLGLLALAMVMVVLLLINITFFIFNETCPMTLMITRW